MAYSLSSSFPPSTKTPSEAEGFRPVPKTILGKLQHLSLFSSLSPSPFITTDAFSLGRPYQAPSLLHLKDVVISTAVDLRRTVPKPALTPSAVSSRSVSPFSRKPSPPRSATPVPTTTGLSFSKSVTDSLKKTNELLNQEVQRLRSQVLIVALFIFREFDVQIDLLCC